MRLDIYLVENSFFTSRELAKYNILQGNVLVNGSVVLKPSRVVNPNESVSLRCGNAMTYVSRGGFKLEKALIEFAIDCKGMDVVDVGASTGGFTDCVLQFGAARVVAIDVGTNQLVESLKTDPRVISFEGVSIKEIDNSILSPNQFHLLVADLSFISLTKVITFIKPLLLPQGSAVLLIKPQFEVGKEHVGKGGIVKSKSAQISAIEEVIKAANSVGLYLKGLIWAPIQSESKNVEFLGHFVQHPCDPIDIKKVVIGIPKE